MAGRGEERGQPVLPLAAEALAGFPAAALLLGPDDAVAAANAEGAAVLAASDPRLSRELIALADTARRAAAASRVALAAAPGTEALLLPLADGARVLALIDDATLTRHLREALIESRRRYKDLVEISSDFAWETDAVGRFTFVSPRGALGWTAEALLGCSVADF
ncbi:MAG TPA: GGDEF domain-containing protein, partial [Stellaceae bacterium]|nr:GGDEF domain-containing protein [Stellaceae bacterium]